MIFYYNAWIINTLILFRGLKVHTKGGTKEYKEGKRYDMIGIFV
jgi:hypothetical protein